MSAAVGLFLYPPWSCLIYTAPDGAGAGGWPGGGAVLVSIDS